MSNGRKSSAGSLADTVLGWIANGVTRRSRLAIAIWIVAVLALAAEGKDLEGKLGVHIPFVSGSEATRAHEISVREFGSDNAMIVMLRGPEVAAERQGRELAATLDAMPRFLVASPWTGGAAVDGLSPRPGVIALLVRDVGEESDDPTASLPPLRQRVHETVADPVRVSITGPSVIVDSLRKATKSTANAGELIAVPILLLVLLFVFRSVIAALIPLVMGGAVVAATRGVLSILSGLVEIDLFVLGATAMMGLALGVDYALLVVSRFREERDRRDLADAVEATVRATARSILPAGSGLLLAMLVAPLVLPNVLVRSVAIGVGTATVLSMISAICVVPALLMSLGDRLDRWSLPTRRASRSRPLRWGNRIASRPGAVLALVAGLLFFSALSSGLDSGVASDALLPPEDAGRRQSEAVRQALGPGWVAPMEVIVSGRDGPVTSPERLRAIAAFQRHTEADPGVASMAGLIQVERGVRRLAGIEDELADSERGLDRLEFGLTRVGHGADRVVVGIGEAAQGSSGLAAGAGAASAGARALAGGLRVTSAGSAHLSAGLGRADEGTGELAQGTSKAGTGAAQLSAGLEKAREQGGELQDSARLLKNAMRSGEEELDALHEPLRSTEEQLVLARQALERMTTGRGDAEYAAVLAAVEEASRRLTGEDPRTGEQVDPAYAGVDTGVRKGESEFGVGGYLAERLDKSGRQAAQGIAKLDRASARLDRGLRHLSSASQRVSDGVAALARGGEELSPALSRLSDGAEHLSGGLELLQGGAGSLTSGLEEGAKGSSTLPRALHHIGAALDRGRGEEGGESQLEGTRRLSPGLFDSAYFVLAALDGSREPRRAALGSLVNLDRGGMDARMLVIPRDEPTSEEARETVKRLQADAVGLARRTGTEVVVGGPAATAIDIDDSLRAQAPGLRFALALVSLIVLIPLLRSLIVPVLAALINLLTVAATFGVAALLFNDSLLGGPGYFDTTNVIATIIVVFGLAIDYEVFVFARIREEYVRTGSTRAAVENGLGRTAHVVTGAAMIMITIFLAFSVSSFVTIRNFGVAQTIAVLIDAFIVRLVIVPAMMLWLGDRCWWLPGWLSRFRLQPERSPAQRG